MTATGFTNAVYAVVIGEFGVVMRWIKRGLENVINCGGNSELLLFGGIRSLHDIALI